ncbi:MAG: DUF1697 domain-containing protein [Thermoplasmata archaeon]
MAVFLALLRAMNVANTQLSMQDLRELLVGLGFTNVRSLLQSGNLVFTAAATGDTEVERRLEGELEKELGIRTDFFVRSPKEWRSLIDHNPFPDEAIKDPAHLVIMFLKDRPSAEAVRSLHDAIQGPERIHSAGREVYVVYPNGIGRSKLTGGLIERKLGTRGTARNWNTVQKMFALTTA